MTTSSLGSVAALLRRLALLAPAAALALSVTGTTGCVAAADDTSPDDASPDDASTDDAAPDDGEDIATEGEDTDDVALIDESARPAGEQASALTSGPQVVFVNFGGPVITTCKDGSGFCNDATRNESSLIKQAFGKTSIDFAAYTNSANKTTIMRSLKAAFSAYDVSFTTTRPSSGAYTMLVISPSRVGTKTSLRGKSYLDCGNSARNDVSFVVRIGSSTPSQIARYAAHELAHTFGLLHVVGTGDRMHHDSSGTKWTVSGYDNATNPKNGDGSPYRCTSGSKQDEPTILKTNLGLKR